MSIDLSPVMGLTPRTQREAQHLRSLLMCLSCDLPYRAQPSLEAEYLRLHVDDVIDPDEGAPTKIVLAQDSARAIVSFRGTARLSLEEGLENFDESVEGWLVNADILGPGVAASDLAPSLNGELHKGFVTLLLDVWPELRRALDKIPADKELFLTGHSQGGALAVLAAAKLAAEGRNPSGVYTFGAPRCGDEKFAALYKPRVTRFELADDLVPLLPPTGVVKEMLSSILQSMSGGDWKLGDTRFRHVGRLHFIDWDGRYYPDAQGLHVTRALRAFAIYSGARSNMFRDHRLPRYAAAIVRELCNVQRAEDLHPNEKLDAYQQILANPTSAQELVDTMEAVSVGRRANAAIYSRLVELADARSCPFEGLSSEDWSYIRQATLWTLGMVNSSLVGRSPAYHLPGLNLLARILLEESDYPVDVCAAAVQSLQVLKLWDNPVIRALLLLASYSDYAGVKSLADRALGGEVIEFLDLPDSADDVGAIAPPAT